MARLKRVMIQALVFDFDGTILDTETPVYEAWRDTFVTYGAEPISFSDWVQSIGLSARQFDPVELLAARLGRPVDRDEVEEKRRLHRNRAIDALPLRSGVVAWIDRASELGIPLAVASSSPRDWVEPHLQARGLRDRFAFLVCAGDRLPSGAGVVPGKPDPTSYRLACSAVGADPRRGVAVEDSPHGVAAARQAGLVAVAVPGPMTAHFDYGGAHVLLNSLADRRLDAMAAEFGADR